MKRSLACAHVGTVTALAMGQNDAHAEEVDTEVSAIGPQIGFTFGIF